jgi:hypothetical protein
MAERPDFSKYVVHFTKDSPPISATRNADAVKDLTSLSAKDRLLRILGDKKIRATRMPWTDREAVCFTECTWMSLFAHAKQYSRYGLGFRKEFLFAAGGGPAIYLTPAMLERQKSFVGTGKDPFDSDLHSFVTPFAPPYMPSPYKTKYWKGKKDVDYSHEREWRVPHELSFDYSKVAFVIVDTYDDMAKAPKALKDAIGRDSWLIMANYEKIEKFWPVHLVP